MDNYRLRYQDAIKDKLKLYLENGSFESLVEINSSVYRKIRDNLKAGAKLFGWPELDEATFKTYYEVVRKEVQANHVTTILPLHMLSKTKKSWLSEKVFGDIKWNYTERYLEYLRSNGRADSVVNEIENSSLKILGRLGNPNSSKPFFIKGLVDGDVQSGKTGNFNAVINRSLDAGYKLVIVLSGIMDDLRDQTQGRIDLDVVGDGIGVGERSRFGHQGNSNVAQVVSITSTDSDFNRPLADANFSLNHTNIMVCKKNVSILRNILLWLYDNLIPNESHHKIPLLIIDDEADNASLNNEGHKGEKYASTINGYIRAILGLFHKKSYLGYTATPFANVIQDRNGPSAEKWDVVDKAKGRSLQFDLVNNLFPDDFIILLDASSNYIGPHSIFESFQNNEKLPLVFEVNDYIPNFPTRVYNNQGNVIGVERFDTKSDWDERVGPHKAYLDFANYSEYRSSTRAAKALDDFPKELPQSIIDAMLCFIIGIAVRETRRIDMVQSNLYQPHNTMLIHVSRFTSWQNRTADLLKRHYKKIIEGLKLDKPNVPNSIYKKFEKVWVDYCDYIIGTIDQYLPPDYQDKFMRPVSFETIVPLLENAASNIEILALNSSTGEKIKYEKSSPRKIIAIGGNRLSRGFTLEGLTISYFVRTTNYSDSLLQMGRWFGYRPGYLDCCKLFTSNDLIRNYNSTTWCIDELKDEFRSMEQKGANPRQFEIRVRTHPGVLKITRPSILKNSTTVKWSFQDSLVMTTEFNVNKKKINSVWEHFRSGIAPLFQESYKSGSMLVAEANTHQLLDILSGSTNFEASRLELIKQYIEKANKKNLLTNWTLALKLTGSATEENGLGKIKPDQSNLPEEVTLAVRRGPKKARGNHFYRDFLELEIFRAGGASRNIMSSGSDIRVALDNDVALRAEEKFRARKGDELRLKNPDLSDNEIVELVEKTTIPERVYRECLPASHGVLVIYLFDPMYTFNQTRGDENEEIAELLSKRQQTLDQPLVGMAIGFPPIERQLDPCGTYVKGDYELETADEDIDDAAGEFVPFDSES